MNQLVKAFTSSLDGAIEQTVNFIPNFLAALLLLIIGLFVAKIVEKTFNKLFRVIGVNRIAEKSGIKGFLQSSEFKNDLSWIFARILYWGVLLLFLLPVSNILGFTLIADLVQSAVSFLPNILVAIIVILIGLWAARIMGGMMKGSAARIGIEQAEILGRAVNSMILLIVLVIALFQLNIEAAILSYILITIVSAFAFGFALAFGLGAKDVVRNIMAGVYINRSFTEGNRVKLQDIEGEIKEVGTMATLIESDDNKEVLIPNVQFLE